MELLRAVSARGSLRLPRSLVCQSCRSQAVTVTSRPRQLRALRPASRLFATTTTTSSEPTTTPSEPTTTSSEPTTTPSEPSKPPKPYYITTPIFYVNAAPHIGHMHSMVLADVLKRWQVLNGKTAFLCTGTDEHGMKVQQAAAAKGVPPKQLCDENAAAFEDLARLANIDYDRFIRTTDPDHIDAVKHFWFLLQEKGLIYESLREGWYSVSDECFYPESTVEKRMDPFTGEVFWASSETGSKVEWIEEKNYHFRMTALKDSLRQFYAKNPEWILPARGMNQVIDWVNKNLEDLSISRPADRLHWGIRVPGDDSQTVYVWVDALINYITKAGFPTWTPGREHEGGWPANVHVVGKDILRFHGVYWPALLMAVDLPLPQKIISHAHWTMGQRKMSKSSGNGVSPFLAIDRWGVDTMRFYLMHDGGLANDADYSNHSIATRYRKMLQGGLGGLASRAMRCRLWDLRKIISSTGTGPPLTRQNPQREAVLRHEETLRALAPSVAQSMSVPDVKVALKTIMQVVDDTHKLMTDTAPWDGMKHDDGSIERAAAEETIFIVAETLRIVGILLLPFMPGKAKELLDGLRVQKWRRDFRFAKPRTDFAYASSWRPMAPPLEKLFPPQAVED
ncbi:tRNA synthetases class I (M)-domain-containing protein [Cercophora scortea]|uniref:Probable methionine--tRNA ligase, mitochondrial n=1 Tax=Cercophora scortea TaxID=314031 RepID=A0AAE0MCK6_9PEZI|nr:tRNA synthetases class I (M)-domain-containing protein [Cercophora scortea]